MRPAALGLLCVLSASAASASGSTCIMAEQRLIHPSTPHASNALSLHPTLWQE